MSIEWKEFTSSSPSYGVPVLVKINGVVQSITYCRDGVDDTEDWLEPFGECVDSDLKREFSFFIDFNSDIKFTNVSDLV